jgi:dTDP-4-dehydrorhamnose reductase
MIIGITGTNGLLGSTFVKECEKMKLNVVSIQRKDYKHSASAKEIAHFLQSSAIKTLIHCAANTDLEHCERNPTECYLDNVFLTEILASACFKLGIKFVYISSTGVYGDWKKEPFNEYDITLPTTVHHNSKKLAEEQLAHISCGHLIIRTGWLFGGTPEMNKNFVMNRIMEARNSDGIIYSDVSQSGNPTNCKDLVNAVFALLKSDCVGVFNLVNSSFATRFDYVQAIIEFANLDVVVKPTDKSAFYRVAKVSENEMAVNLKFNKLGIGIMPDWKSSLSEYVSGLLCK